MTRIVPCPLCGAGIGLPCLDRRRGNTEGARSGKPMRNEHAERKSKSKAVTAAAMKLARGSQRGVATRRKRGH